MEYDLADKMDRKLALALYLYIFVYFCKNKIIGNIIIILT
jgi:hypothetical protein